MLYCHTGTVSIIAISRLYFKMLKLDQFIRFCILRIFTFANFSQIYEISQYICWHDVLLCTINSIIMDFYYKCEKLEDKKDTLHEWNNAKIYLRSQLT